MPKEFKSSFEREGANKEEEEEPIEFVELGEGEKDDLEFIDLDHPSKIKNIPRTKIEKFCKDFESKTIYELGNGFQVERKDKDGNLIGNYDFDKYGNLLGFKAAGGILKNIKNKSGSKG